MRRRASGPAPAARDTWPVAAAEVAGVEAAGVEAEKAEVAARVEVVEVVEVGLAEEEQAAAEEEEAAVAAAVVVARPRS